MILIHTILNVTVGIGNFSRCYSIFKQLEMDGEECIFLVEGNQELVSQFDLTNIIFIIENDTIFSLLHRHTGIFVIDIPVAPLALVYFYRERREKVISINDQYALDIEPSIYINGDNSKNYIFNNTRKYAGAEYQIIRNDLKTYRPLIYPTLHQIRNIGIMFGGSDPGLLTEKFINELQGNDYYGFTFHIFLGSGISKNRKLSLKSKTLFNVIYIDNKLVADFFNEIDVLITMGGITSYEAMYVGVPVLSIEWKYMGQYVSYLGSLGLLVNLGDFNDETLTKLVHALSNLENINRIGQYAFETINGYGLNKVCSIILARQRELGLDK
ncbi:hypothetical protein [Lysinibacillus sp. Y5S-8]|uniref:hypothetical protein n=1 Tax=Lysinibacillus sp. Y5S-8 TaxID=3122488 RepID=UPI0030D38877